MDFISGDLGERGHHKVPVCHIRMRNDKIRLFRNQIIIEKNIQIQCAWSPMNQAFPSGLRFDFMQKVQKFGWFEKSTEKNRTI